MLSQLEKINERLPTPGIRFEMRQFDAKELIAKSEFLSGPNAKPTLVCTYTKKLTYSTVAFFAAFAVLTQLVFWKSAFWGNPAYRTNNLLISGVLSVLSGGAAIMSIFLLSRQQPRLIIDADGIRIPKDGVLLKWSDMTALGRRRDMWKHSYIDVYLKDETAYFNQLSPKRRFVAKLGRTRIDPTFSFIASTFDIPEDRIYKTIEKYAAFANLQSRFGD